MRKTTALGSFILLISLSGPAPAGGAERSVRKSAWLAPGRHAIAASPAPQAKQPQWKSREEYDVFSAMATEKDANKRISLAEAFLQKFSTSDFKDSAYVVEMQTYQQLNQPDKAMEAGRKALEVNPDNRDALGYLSFAFPFVFKADDPDATTKLSRAESDAKHGLEVLEKWQQPAGATAEQFNQAVKSLRSVFNNAIGFVALQRKDYAAAITSGKAAAEDNPSDVYTFYRLGLAYLYSSPPDYDHAVWYIARAVSLAHASKNPAGDEIEKFLKRAYVNYHGNDQGLQDIVTQAATAPNPPEGFKVAAMEVPKDTGNPNIDAFNKMTFTLKLGGEKAQKTWDALKGQTIELGGYIDGVEKGSDANTYLVRIDILDQSKSVEGVYDIELKDSTQSNAKNLQKGDIVRFKGTADSYAATPNLVLTLLGEITTDLPDKPPVKEKPKPKAPVRRRAVRKPPA